LEIIEKKLETSGVVIAPFGDFQYGNNACSVSYARRYFDFVKETARAYDVPYYFLGMGDYMDLMSPSNRSRYKQSGLYGSTRRSIEERTAVPIMQEAYEILQPYMEGRTLALCQGHHWMALEFGMIDSIGFPHYHTDTWLAAMLGCKNFVEGAAIVKFEFPSGRIYKVHITHGEGNGSTMVYGLNKLGRQSKSWEGIDCFAMGHTHKVGFAAEVSIYEEDGQLRARQKPLLTSGAFMRSYLVGEINYPEEKQLGALALGGTILLVKDMGDGPSGLLQAPIGVL
jgi:hypothetical protein